MSQEKIQKIIDTLKVLLKSDNVEIIKCVLESIIEELEEANKK